MLFKRLESLLGIRSGEWSETIFFWSFNMLLWFSLGLGDAISDTLFIKRVGYEKLPLMFIACSACSIFLSVIFASLQSRYEKRKLTLILGFFTSALLLAGIKLAELNNASFTGIYYYLYLIKSAFLVLILMNFSVLIGTQFNSFKGKRLIPIIFTGAIAGQIASGIFINIASANFSAQNILWSWLVIHGSAFILFFFASEKTLKNPLKKMSRRELRKQKPLFSKLRSLGAIVSSSKIVIFLVISSFLATLTYYFADFQSAGILSRHFSSESELARFYGYFNIASSILAFLVQTLLTGSLINKLGVGNSNVIFPVISLSAFLGTLYSFTLYPSIILKFVSEGLSQALYVPSEKLLYNAFPPKDKAMIINLVEGVIIPLASVVAGTLILLVGNSNYLVKIIPCVIGLLWVINNILLISPYKKSLMKLLRSSNLSFHNRRNVERLPLDKQTIRLMSSIIDTADDDSVKLIFQLVLNNADRKTKDAFIKKIQLLDDKRKAKIIDGLKIDATINSRNFYLSCLESGNRKLVNIALKGLSPFPSSEKLRSLVSPMLDSDETYTRGLAAVILVRIGDLTQMMDSMKVINNMLTSESLEERVLGIDVLGFTHDERFWVNLKPFLYSEEIRERLAAVKSFENLVSYGSDGEYYEMIGQLLKDRNREIRYLALKIVSKLSGKRWFYHAIEGLSDISPRNRNLAEEILVSKYDEMIPELMMILENNNSTIYAKTSVAKILAASQDVSVRQYLHQFGKQIISKIYEYKVEEFVFNRDFGRSKSEYIQMLLNERAWEMVKLIVSLVAPEQNREARDLFKSLYSTNEEMIGNAIEVLQNMGESKLVYHIIPILENISLKDIAGYGMKVFEIHEREAEVVIGKYLSSSDPELREAAIFTVCQAELESLMPMIKNIEKSKDTKEEIRNICSWALKSLDGKGLVAEYL